MEYSAIGMVSVRANGCRPTRRCATSSVTAGPLQSLTFQQLTWPEDLDTDLEQLEQLVNGEINTLKRYYTRNGEVVWALLAVSVRCVIPTVHRSLFYRSD